VGLGTAAAAPWDAATGVAIGADWLLAAIAPGSAFGRAARERERPFRRGDEAAALVAIGRVDGVARALDAARLGALRAAIAAAPETAGALARAAAGGVLGDVDFFEMTRFLDALSEVEALLAAVPPAGLDAPAVDEALRRSLAPGRTPARSFYLDDAFGGDLAAARGELAAAQAAYDAARSRLTERVAAELGVERVRDGEFVVMRERAPQPLPRAVRVMREAPTYFLCEVALDEAAQAALATRDRTADAVAQAEERVRASLSARVAAAAGGLDAAARALGELDLLLARAQFAQRYGCSVPALAEDSRVSFEAARYLPLAETLEQHARSYVPVSLDLAGVGIVTGPNMGGKTAALRTLGFLAACVSLGLPVPAARASIPLFDDVAWIGIGSGENGKRGEPAAESALLSAFGSEVVALRGLLERDAGRTLVLVDEFARTTSPREGRALLVAVVETLRERGACGLVATHLAGIAAAAGVPHFSSGALRTLDGPAAAAPLSLEVALRRIASAMDYRLERVDEDAVPATDALALAEALGLDTGVIARARDALG
jgi:hypothetical protein